MLNVLYNLLSIMVAETQKGRDNFVSHHCLIKFLVEKSLHDVSGITYEEFINVDQFRPKQLQPRVLPQPRTSSRRLSMVKATSGASTSSAGSSVNPPIAEEPYTLVLLKQSTQKNKALH